MGLFLQIVGGLVVAVVILLVVGWFWLKWKIGKFAAELGEACAQWVTSGSLPSRVQLEPLDDPEWQDEADVNAAAVSLRRLGYKDCGTFHHSGLPVLGFAHPGERVNALVAEHPESGLFVDLAIQFQSGDWTTVSTAPDPGLDRPAYMPIERLCGRTVPDLHAGLLERRGVRPCRETPPSDFVATIARYSDEELLWRVARGGPTAQEIRHVAELSGQKVDDEQVEQARDRMRVSQMWEAIEALKDRFLEQATISAKDWDQMQEGVLFIHDALSAEEVVERIDGEIEWEDEAAADRFAVTAKLVAESRPARTAFAAITGCAPGGQTFERVGTVAGPLPADVYRVVERHVAVGA